MGAGRTELCVPSSQLISWIVVIEINGSVAYLSSPRKALNEGLGLAPEDRKTQGMVLSMPIGHNATIPSLSEHGGPFG